MSTTLLIKAKTSQKVLEEAVAIGVNIESKLSAYRQDSDIVSINKKAGAEAVFVNTLTLEAISIALEMAEATEGLFDPTIGALSHFGYQFGWRDEKVPTEKECQTLSQRVNYKDVLIHNGSVKLKQKGMALDLGGIGKGFAVGKIVSFLQSKGVAKALVSLGGEVYALGKKWKVGVEHPRKKALIAMIETDPKGMCITTSGDYERFIKDYDHHHILSASSGKSENVFSSLSLVSIKLDPARMDALNTALFQLPWEKQKSFYEKYALEAMAFDKELKAYMSQGSESLFRLNL